MLKLTKMLGLGLLLAVSFVASAGNYVNPETKVTLQVNTFCEINPTQDSYIWVQRGQADGRTFDSVGVRCNDALPYTIEVDAEAGGLVAVTDANTGKVYDVKFMAAALNNEAFGTVANGEAISAIGSGEWQNYPITIGFNEDLAYGMPQVGRYIGTKTYTITF